MKQIAGGVCAATGFSASGVHCGIRKNKTKRDLALIYSSVPASAAAVYTTNLVKGAPLVVTKRHLADGKAQAIICNSGNANTCNANGIEIAEQMSSLLGQVLDAAVFKIRKLLSGSMQKIPVEEGEILRLSPDSIRASETFSMKKLYQFQLCQSPYYGSCWPDVQDNTGYAEELRRIAPAFGFSTKDVDTLLRGGMLPEEIEEYFYCAEGRENVWSGMCSDF